MCKNALPPPPPHPPPHPPTPPPRVVYSTGRSKARVPVLVLLFVVLWFSLRGDYLFYVLPCVILFLFFLVLLALRLPHLGKRELILVLFVRLFDLCLFWICRICRFRLPLRVWEGLRFVIVALPGLFSYRFTFVFRLVSQGSLCFGIVTFPVSLYLIYILLLPAIFLTLRINVTYSFINTIHSSV